MTKENNSIRGMHDYLPEEVRIWQYVENILKKIFSCYCYTEIRLPILEYTSLFHNTVGNTTEIFEKEIYSFNDRNNKNITLRPEGTIGCVRASIKHNLINKKIQRLWYLGPMFRYERPQKGRYRQFYQMGAEIFGIKEPTIDLEIIMLTSRFWKMLDIADHVTLEINSIGSIDARANFQNHLVLFLEKHKYSLDADCLRRLYTNPLRILDSKNIKIQNLLKTGPQLSNYLDQESSIHFNQLCNLIKSMNISYIINQNLIRGLDYYNSTVFEWKTKKLGTQNTICAGGRYDLLIEKIGGISTPAIGFALGMERLILLLKKIKPQLICTYTIDIYVMTFDYSMKLDAVKLSEYIRNKLPNLKIMTHLHNENIKKQFQLANKYQARIALLLGLEEKEKKSVLVKNMYNRKQKIVLQSLLIEELSSLFQYKK